MRLNQEEAAGPEPRGLSALLAAVERDLSARMFSAADRPENTEGLEYWRNRIFLLIAVGSLLVAPPLLLMGAAEFLRYGRVLNACMELFIYVPLCLVLTRRKLAARVRKVLLVDVLYLFSLLLLIATGPTGAAPQCIVGTLVLAGCILERDQAHRFAWMNLFVMGAFTAGIQAGLPLTTELALYGDTWLLNMLVGQVIGVTFLVFVQEIYGGLEEQSRKAKEAQARAEAANAAKSQFLSNMAHEIRTPLNGLAGVVQLMETTRLDPEQVEYVRLAGASLRPLVRLIDDILDYSRMEAGRFALERNAFDLDQLLRDVSGLFEWPCRQKGLELDCAADGPMRRGLVGDRFRVRQVLVNLVGNALKFTEQGVVRVRVREASRPTSGKVTLQFEVSDTGVGIPSPQLDAIFEGFHQVDNSDTRQFGGAGLGLAISQRLARKMGGRVWAQSEVGRGSTFFFTCVVAEGAA